ncbi:MAG: DUF2141 domain-containing protein [Cyclobacteriaceae bacterium]|nr:DUF2141 domain-containing protein [Cyclobacteriaceae bacterium]
MKQIGFVIFFLSAVISANGQQLLLNVENIDSKSGQLIISLFSNADDFLKKPVYEKFVSVDQAAYMTIELTDVPEGDYALCVVHDENGNGNIDTNFLKIPKEAYGFSHNPNSKFGPPKFHKAKFSFRENLELTVLLN